MTILEDFNVYLVISDLHYSVSQDISGEKGNVGQYHKVLLVDLFFNAVEIGNIMACDIFRSHDVKKLLKKRGVYLIGDSNVRCLYKDLIHLMYVDDITSPVVFRSGVSIVEYSLWAKSELGPI
ncbi:uncharacterized protein [Palaemon carinicauda]|uniref:uncharacterized protein n=1 Tax=Palaemon carinicauda TaxID=392227 RepID=UPI0035B5B497